MRLRVHGGLANRLQAILSYRAAFAREHGHFVVEWKPDSQVSFASWDEVFQPLPGVEFVTAATDASYTELEGADFVDNHPYQGAPQDWPIGYRDVLLLNDMAPKTIKQPFAALHVRRTDHVQLAHKMGCFIPDSEFLDWLSRQNHGLVYLATDNSVTQRNYQVAIDEMGKTCLRYQTLTPGDGDYKHDFRNSTLEHAAIDLFTCARADAFMGTRGSSFSNTAQMLHRLGGWWSE